MKHISFLTGQYKMQTAECRLQTGSKMQTTVQNSLSPHFRPSLQSAFYTDWFLDKFSVKITKKTSRLSLFYMASDRMREKH